MDDYPNRTPPPERFKPPRSPSVEHVYVPDSDSDSTEEEDEGAPEGEHKGARRRSRSYRQRAHGNMVLVGFLTGGNDPELANDVCDNPIEADVGMGSNHAPENSERNSDGHGATRFQDRRDIPVELRPAPIATYRGTSLGGSYGVREATSEIAQITPRSPGGPAQHDPPPQPLSHGSRHQEAFPAQRGDDSETISPQLRQHAITASVGSPMDTQTLPAMQTSPTSAKRLPSSPQQLPSLQSQLADALPLLPNAPVSLPGRPANPQNPNLPSPSPDFGTPRSGPYSAGSRPTHYPIYPPSEPSPSSAASGPSPREPFATPHSSVGVMSPTSRFGGPAHMSPNGSAPGPPPPLTKPPLSSMQPQQAHGPQQQQTEVQTPLSASTQIQTPLSARTQTSITTLSSESSPVADRVPGPDDVDHSTLPPVNPNGSAAAGNGQYRCDYPGCTAAAFQTQYLLNSHANVHSSSRPHYCSVKGCPRSEGGRGFKRKNEMIRHGLVHQSPGYICPFCPEREHKYPRPDNLQRHVRVHHVDKDKDDPMLRDVLAQRPEGGSRGRRRRVNS